MNFNGNINENGIEFFDSDNENFANSSDYERYFSYIIFKIYDQLVNHLYQVCFLFFL